MKQSFNWSLQTNWNLFWTTGRTLRLRLLHVLVLNFHWEILRFIQIVGQRRRKIVSWESNGAFLHELEGLCYSFAQGRSCCQRTDKQLSFHVILRVKHVQYTDILHNKEWPSLCASPSYHPRWRERERESQLTVLWNRGKFLIRQCTVRPASHLMQQIPPPTNFSHICGM